jgi:signal transduction histidine kinase
LSITFSSSACNFLKSSRSRGGKIWLTAELKGDTVSVAVRDTGLGIPSANLPSIFDMFSQVDRSIERSTGGLGIVLALVKGLTEMHGETVTAESDGSGSFFTVTLLSSPPQRRRG